MPTIFDPNIFDRYLYSASDAMKDVLSDYASPVSEIESIVSALGLVAEGAGTNGMEAMFAENVGIAIGNERHLLPADSALIEVGRLAKMTGIRTILYDETQMIFTSEAIGLANGLVWIVIHYSIEHIGMAQLRHIDARIAALNFEH